MRLETLTRCPLVSSRSLYTCSIWLIMPISMHPYHASTVHLSGHSKWSTIKHKKAALDHAKRLKWQKIASRITVAVKLGGADPATNPRLEQELAHAKAENMKKDAMIRAIVRGEPRAMGTDLSAMTYEAMMPGGIAMIIEVMTDNKARTTAKIKELVSSSGGSFSKVLYQFIKRGLLIVRCDGKSFEQLLEETIDCGIEDIRETNNGSFRVFLRLEDVSNMARIFKALGCDIQVADTVWLPLREAQHKLEPSSEEAKKLSQIMDDLDAEDDVTGVYSNVIFGESL